MKYRMLAIWLAVAVAALAVAQAQTSSLPYGGEPDEAKIIATAIEGVTILYNQMRDPQSFQLHRVLNVRFVLNGRWGQFAGMKVDHFCYDYGARNGFGGMNRGYAMYALYPNKRHPERSAYRMVSPEEAFPRQRAFADGVCVEGAKGALAVNDITEDVNKALKALAEK